MSRSTNTKSYSMYLSTFSLHFPCNGKVKAFNCSGMATGGLGAIDPTFARMVLKISSKLMRK